MMQLYLSKLKHVWFELHQHYDFSEPQKIYDELIAAYSENSEPTIPSNIYVNV